MSKLFIYIYMYAETRSNNDFFQVCIKMLDKLDCVYLYHQSLSNFLSGRPRVFFLADPTKFNVS